MTHQKNVITVLRQAKRSGRELDSACLKEVSAELAMPFSAVAGVAGFYSEFNGMSDGAVDMACALAGSEGELFTDDGYAAVSTPPEKTLALLTDAGIAGCSGSGFPTAQKWELTARTESGEKYVVCNGSEGEGDTYKDLKLLLHAPAAVIEGILLCAKAVGAKNCLIYVRSEYGAARETVEKELERARSLGLLEDVSFTVFAGAGAYVCGEETALLRSVEGLRGEPALKPPYPGVRGLYGLPTVVGNVESFAAAAACVRGGKRSKLYTVSGSVARPGVYEMPYGTTAAKLAKAAGGGEAVCGFQLGGGATGAMLGADMLTLPLSFEECRRAGVSLGTASVRFFASPSDALALSAASLRFLASQSCGKCAPCRLGVPQLAELLERVRDGEGTVGMLEEITQLCRYLEQSSRCAFGQAAPNAAVTAMTNFKAAFEAAVR